MLFFSTKIKKSFSFPTFTLLSTSLSHASTLMQLACDLFYTASTLLVTMPRSAITTSLAATFATQFASAASDACYRDKWNRHYHIKLLFDDIFPYVNNILTKDFGLIASPDGNQFDFCPSIEKFSGCFHLFRPDELGCEYTGDCSLSDSLWIASDFNIDSFKENCTNIPFITSRAQDNLCELNDSSTFSWSLVFKYLIILLVVAIILAYLINKHCNSYSFFRQRRYVNVNNHDNDDNRHLIHEKSLLKENKEILQTLLYFLKEKFKLNPEEITNEFDCPITKEMMLEIAKIESKTSKKEFWHYFDFDSIVTWIKSNPEHPLTRQSVRLGDIKSAPERQKELIDYLIQVILEKEKIITFLEKTREYKEEKEDYNETNLISSNFLQFLRDELAYFRKNYQYKDHEEKKDLESNDENSTLTTFLYNKIEAYLEKINQQNGKDINHESISMMVEDEKETLQRPLLSFYRW